MRIRIQLLTHTQIRIQVQLPKIMRILSDPIRIHNTVTDTVKPYLSEASIIFGLLAGSGALDAAILPVAAIFSSSC
jgi:hypothetical protein